MLCAVGNGWREFVSSCSCKEGLPQPVTAGTVVGRNSDRSLPKKQGCCSSPVVCWQGIGRGEGSRESLVKEQYSCCRVLGSNG